MRMRMTQLSLAHAHCIFNEGTEILSHMSYHQPSFTYIRSPFHILILTKNTTHLITWHNTPSDMTWVPFLIYAWRHRNTALWLVGPKPTSFTTFVINLKWMVGGQVNPIISIITDNNNDNSNNNNNNNILNFSSGGGEKCSHQLRPSGFKIFVGK